MQKKIITVCIIAFFIITVIPLCTADQNLTGKDWWTLEHHDTNNNGLSSSKSIGSNRRLWVQTTNDDIYASPIVDHGRVYIGSSDNSLYCFHAETGEELWHYSVDYPVDETPAIWEGKIYFSFTGDGHIGWLYCLDAITGSFLWRYAVTDGLFDNSITTAATVVDGYVYFGSINAHVYCLNAFTGDVRWSILAYNMVYSNPAVVDGKVYFGTYTGFLFCVSTQTGDILWYFDAREPNPEELPEWWWPINTDPCIYRDNVIFVRSDGMVFCLNISLEGQEKWRTPAGWGGLSSPAVAYDHVYYGSYSLDDEGEEGGGEFGESTVVYGKLYCLNISDGQIFHTYTLDDISTVHIGVTYCSVADHKVYFGTDCLTGQNYVYCVDAYQCKYLWRSPVGGRIFSTPAIADNKLYVSCEDHNLYCFEDEDAQYPSNQPPFSPSDPSPANNSNDQSTVLTLGWTGEDPDEEPATYDIYFGTTNPPPKIAANITTPLYAPTGLNQKTPYYWRIVAWDNHGAQNTGELWTFTTLTTGIPPPPITFGISFTTPKDGYLYIAGIQLWKRLSGNTLLIGPTTIKVQTAGTGITKVDFYVDGTLIGTDRTAPYSIQFQKTGFAAHKIKAIATSNSGRTATTEILVQKFF